MEPARCQPPFPSPSLERGRAFLRCLPFILPRWKQLRFGRLAAAPTELGPFVRIHNKRALYPLHSLLDICVNLCNNMEKFIKSAIAPQKISLGESLIKREPGGNPGRSRHCDSLSKATMPLGKPGKAPWVKTLKSGDLLIYLGENSCGRQGFLAQNLSPWGEFALLEREA